MPCTVSEVVDLGSSGIVRYGDDAVVSVGAVALLAYRRLSTTCASGRQEHPRRCPARRCYLLLSPIFPETQVELGSYRNESRRTRMRFARAGVGSAVVCVWRNSTDSRMCIATGKSIPGWTLGAQQRMNVTTPLHRRSGRSCRFVWLVCMVVAVVVLVVPCSFIPGLRARCSDETIFRRSRDPHGLVGTREALIIIITCLLTGFMFSDVLTAM